MPDAIVTLAEKMLYLTDEKRSRALRGRNSMRNSRIDGAPKRTSPRACRLGTALLRDRIGYRSDASKNPGGEADVRFAAARNS